MPGENRDASHERAHHGCRRKPGSKLHRHLEGRYRLKLLDIDPRGDRAIVPADVGRWDKAWVDQLHGVDVVVHLAANPAAHQSWPDVIGPNIDGAINLFQAAVQGGVKRVVYASSNHVMGGYQDDPEPPHLTTDLSPRPARATTSRGSFGTAPLMPPLSSSASGWESVTQRLVGCR